MRTPELLERFRVLLEKHQADRMSREYPDFFARDGGSVVKVTEGRRWVRVDVGNSGKYMVDQDGAIYGIKAYGVPHLGHRYGTLETIDDWDWSGYVAHHNGI